MLPAVLDPRLTVRVVERRRLYYQAGADAALDRPAHVRSASGLARWRGRLAVVSDDANFVGLVDPGTGACEAITLPAGAGGQRQFDAGRGNKPGKLDLESLFADGDRLIALGSDSGLAVRRHAVVVDAHGAIAIAVPRLYQALHRPELGRGRLNLEGATVAGDALVLGNRGGDAGDDGVPTHDALAWVPMAAVRALLADPDGAPVPEVRWQLLDLGALDGVALRLTELEAWAGALCYTAAAEATTSAYDDGAVAGSALGVIVGGQARWAPVLDEQGARLVAKLEGLVADGERLLASVDADDPAAASELLVLALDGPWRDGR